MQIHTNAHTDSCTGTLSALTSEQVETVRVEQLEAKEGENDLKRERAAIHKVAIEQLNRGLSTMTRRDFEHDAFAVLVLNTDMVQTGRTTAQDTRSLSD